ncbi:MAG: hypothetical protein KatS3mg015_2470 [Fimbriimonadales bacterium]|nr:MAG: hypothetical protein KatS3mg015_2470 [Fimbriimonadales bacterium]
MIRFALVASIGIMPGLAVTSIEQDVWLMQAQLTWSEREPYSFWLMRLFALGLLVWAWRRLRHS